MNKKKIFNDPIYGFISIEYDIIFDLIEHPTFQRLRRIRQLGLTHLTYPGANHTRFHHALGAMHLVSLAIHVLRSKGIAIEKEEAEATCIAILLHDIGHGPFSHALEKILIDCSHETLSLELMSRLNKEFEGKLDLAIEIFSGRYDKSFLFELISGQLDMDRMDYLARDSFYSGVIEGKIGYDRIITMLNVVDNRLVVEEKGVHSIEAFLVARKIMYWQVYLHKAVLAAELMLVKAMSRVKELYQKGTLPLTIPSEIKTLFDHRWKQQEDQEKLLNAFLKLDDYDIVVFFKKSLNCGDYLLDLLTQGLIQRRLFRVELSNYPFKSDYVKRIRLKVVDGMGKFSDQAGEATIIGKETVSIYEHGDNEIRMLSKSGKVFPLSAFSKDLTLDTEITKYYLCYPKL